MMPPNRRWHLDWAGPHGTMWGTVNTCLTVLSVAWLAHRAQTLIPVAVTTTVLMAVVVTVAAVIVVLLRAAVASKRRHSVTVAYQIACVAGAGVWTALVLTQASWPWRWLLGHVLALAVMAAVAGIAAGLASDRPVPPAPAVPAPQPPEPKRAQQVRDALADEWVQRLDRTCSGDGYTVPSVEHWPRRNGYTVEAIVPLGQSWKSIGNRADDLGADLDLPHGCALTVTMGVTRRAALIEVTTVDLLAGDYPYPTDRAPHSIKDDLSVGTRDDGERIGPNLRQYCMAIGGEAGSGKSNGAHCYTAEIVTTIDALQWDWDPTGKMWAAWMEDWLRNPVGEPPIDWCASSDGQEMLWMTRAALRVGLARSAGYRQLMIDVDDDKVPVSPSLPALIVAGDEVARVTGSLSEFPDVRENLRLITFEHRAAAVRAIFFALRGTDDVLSSSIQSQCQVTGVMKVKSKAEANWMFGTSYEFGPADTPYPGCGGLSLESGQEPIRLKYDRMLPSTIRVIARLAAPRRPQLDPLSRMAANGRNPDGSPMADLFDGELDCYDTRWDRFRAQYGGAQPGAAAMPTAASSPPAQPAALRPADAMAAMNSAFAALDAAVAEQGSDSLGDIADLTDNERDEFERMMGAEGFGPDWADSGEPETPVVLPRDEQIMLELIAEAGPQGIQPKELLKSLESRGIVISRDTLHERLNEQRKKGTVFQPRHGRWALQDRP